MEKKRFLFLASSPLRPILFQPYNTRASETTTTLANVVDATTALETCQQSLFSAVSGGGEGPDALAMKHNCGGGDGAGDNTNVVVCRSYPDLVHGQVKGAGVLPGAIRLVSCDEGYSLSTESALVRTSTVDSMDLHLERAKFNVRRLLRL